METLGENELTLDEMEALPLFVLFGGLGAQVGGVRRKALHG